MVDQNAGEAHGAFVGTSHASSARPVSGLYHAVARDGEREFAMPSEKDSNGDYTAMITDDTEEKYFLRSTPWILDAHPQSPDPLTNALRYESSRFKELPQQPWFSLLTVLRDTRSQHLSQLILSLRCQSYQNWELLLIDDGSKSRKHLDIARCWAERDRRISLKCLESPLGPSRAKNLAVEESTGDYLIVTDGDGVLHPMALGVFARHINDNPKVNFVYANEAEIDAGSICLTNFLLKPPFDLFTLLRSLLHRPALRRGSGSAQQGNEWRASLPCRI